MRSMNRDVPDILTVVKCPGRSYSGSTLLRQMSTMSTYGWQSAVCESCHTRVYLTAGKLSDHWLTVTIHEVRGNIHEVDENGAGK